MYRASRWAPTQCTIAIFVDMEGGGGALDVPGYVPEPACGLALTPDQDEPERWTITHLPSGQAVLHGLMFMGGKLALQKLASSAVDWTRSAEEVTKDPIAVKLVRSFSSSSSPAV